MSVSLHILSEKKMLLLGIFAILVFIFIIYYKLWSITKYWKSRGVLHMPPRILLGNMTNVVFKKQIFCHMLTQLYNEAKTERYIGAHYFTEPRILLKDLDLIKEVCMKSFQTFPIHSGAISERSDPLMSQVLLFINEEKKWRLLRTAVSPAFTSLKIKGMFGLMNNCALNLMTNFEDCSNTVTLEINNLFSKFTTDVIGNCAIGVSCNSFKHPNNEFYKLVMDAMRSVNSPKLLAHDLNPKLADFLKIRIFSKQHADYWNNFINKIIALRENGNHRKDLMQLLVQVKNGELSAEKPKIPNSDNDYQLTNQDIASQALMFVLAGFDTSSSALVFATYELAFNLDAQTTLQQEIDSVLNKRGQNSITYEDLTEMKYMTAVVTETLRKWPVVPYTTRKSVQEYTIQPTRPNEKPITLESGIKLWIPTFAIHRDPKHYPDPDKFDPGRFLDKPVTPGSYFPFGLGPRACLGKQFSTLEIKLVLFHILSKFTIVPVENTINPMVIKGVFIIAPRENCYLGFKPR